MKQYAVKITETLEKVVYIEADSRIEAEAIYERSNSFVLEKTRF